MIDIESEAKNNYMSRINKALKFIDANLNSDLSLEKIADSAHYSPFHFHRIFKAVTNETLNSYITRKRIEKAATVLFRRKEIPISDLSLNFGFSGNSSFTRAFKNFYGVSPTEFRRLSRDKFSKISQEHSKNGKEYKIFEDYICNITELKNWIVMNAKIKTIEMPKLELAYITHIGNPDKLHVAYAKLIRWATPKGLMSGPNVKMLTIYHDSFKVTKTEKIRTSACIILNKPTEVSDGIDTKTLNPGKCIVGHFTINSSEFEKSWSSLYVWMNEHGYTTADQNPFEIYHNNYNEHPEKKFIVNFFIPIE